MYEKWAINIQRWPLGFETSVSTTRR